MVPKVEPLLILISFLFLFSLAEPSEEGIKYEYHKIQGEHTITIDITNILQEAQEKNMAVRMFFNSSSKINYEIVKCEHVLLGTRNAVQFHEVDFEDKWIKWVSNINEKKCNRKQYGAKQLQLRLFPTTTTSGEISFTTTEKKEKRPTAVFNGYWLESAQLTANVTRIFKSGMASEFKKVIARDDLNLHLITEFPKKVKIGFGKCNFNISCQYTVETADVIVRNQVMEQIEALSDLYCPMDETANSFEILLTSSDDVTGFFAFNLVDQEEKFLKWLSNFGLIVFIIIGMISNVIFILNCKREYFCIAKKKKKTVQTDNFEMKRLSPRCQCKKDSSK